jgi:hypothetical protein
MCQFSNVEDFPAANGTNVFVIERKQGNCFTISGYEFHLEGSPVTVAVHDCSYVTLLQTLFDNVMCQDDGV